MEKKLLDWTVMVYMAGDNNLTAECIYALTEIKKANRHPRIKIIAQFDPKDDYLRTRRFELKSPASPGKLLNDDLGGAPFEESRNADLRARAHAAGLKACRKCGTAEARKFVKTKIGNGTRSTAFIAATGIIESFGNGSNGGPAQLAEGETDTGSPITLYEFMSYCVERFPAKHYMVVLSGHASATEPNYLMKDESPDGSLTINELRQAFETLKPELGDNRKIDILGLDACLMSATEICYELKDLVHIMVGCESYSPASGWPYREILNRLVKLSYKHKDQSSDIIRESVAKAIVEEYVNFYADYWLGGLSVDQSALNLERVEELTGNIDALAGALIDALENLEIRQQIVLAHWETQSYNGEQFIDLFDFCQLLKEYDKIKENMAIYKAVDALEQIKDKFVLGSCYSGPAYQYSHGVSIYFPWAKVATSYKELSFAADSKWAEFLKTYTEKTRRQPRIENADRNSDTVRKILSSNLSFTPQSFRQTQEKGSGNPIYSMRNPPIFALPGRKNMLESFRKVLATNSTDNKKIG